MEKKKRTTLYDSIAQQKISKTLICVLLVICVGFSGFFSMRGILSLSGFGIAFLTNDVAAFIISSIYGGVSIFFIVNILFSLFGRQFGNKSSLMKYSLLIFLIPAYLLSGAVKILYFFYPYLSVYGDVFVDFIFQLIFVSLYTAFCCKKFFFKQDYYRVTLTIMSAFLIMSVIFSALSLISGVIW